MLFTSSQSHCLTSSKRFGEVPNSRCSIWGPWPISGKTASVGGSGKASCRRISPSRPGIRYQWPVWFLADCYLIPWPCDERGRSVTVTPVVVIKVVSEIDVSFLKQRGYASCQNECFGLLWYQYTMLLIAWQLTAKAATIDYLNAHGTNLRKAKMSLVEHARQLHKILASTAYHKILAVKASRCFDWLLYWHFEQYSSGRCPARMVGKSQHQTHQTNGKIQWENPDALRTAPSQRTQTKQNTTMIMIIMMLCSYSRFLCRITSQLYRPSHERLGRPMLGPLMTDWHSSVQQVQSQIRKHVLSIFFPLNVQTLLLKILGFFVSKQMSAQCSERNLKGFFDVIRLFVHATVPKSWPDDEIPTHPRSLLGSGSGTKGSRR